MVTLSIFYPMLLILIMLVEWQQYVQLSFLLRICLFGGLELCLLILAVLLPSLHLPKVTHSIALYLIAWMLLAGALHWRTHSQQLSFLFPVAGIIVFVAADFWELPVFVYGSLGNPVFAAWAGQWFDQIHRFYVLGVLGAMMKLTKWQATHWSVLLLILSVIAPFGILAAAPLAGETARAVTLACVGGSILGGLKQ